MQNSGCHSSRSQSVLEPLLGCFQVLGDQVKEPGFCDEVQLFSRYTSLLCANRRLQALLCPCPAPQTPPLSRAHTALPSHCLWPRSRLPLHQRCPFPPSADPLVLGPHSPLCRKASWLLAPDRTLGWGASSVRAPTLSPSHMPLPHLCTSVPRFALCLGSGLHVALSGVLNSWCAIM